MILWLLLYGHSSLSAAEYRFSTIAGRSNVGSHDGTAPVAAFHNPLGLTVDASGNTYVVDSSNRTIRKITPGGIVSTFAGNPDTSAARDGTGTDARFSYPVDIAIDSHGNLFVADSTAIRKITPNRVVTTFAGAFDTSALSDGTGTTARFQYLQGICIDSSDVLYVSDWKVIRRIMPDSTVVTLAGSGASGDDDGIGAGASFRSPKGLTIGADNAIYVADSDAQVIRKVTSAGVVTTLCGAPGITDHVDGNASTARFQNPIGIAWNGSHLFVTEQLTIRKVTITGDVTTYTGKDHLEPGHLDGPIAIALFAGLSGISADGNGGLILSDSRNQNIRSISSGDIVTTRAGNADSSGSTNARGVSSRFDGPFGIAASANGTMYITTKNDFTVRAMSPSGNVTTLAGLANFSGSSDGEGTSARFISPDGIAVGPDGNIFVADFISHTIRKITPSGAVSTYAGSAGAPGDTDATGSSARFRNPSGVAVATDGTVYVADSGNHVIRAINTSQQVTTFVGTIGVTGSNDANGTAASFSSPLSIAFNSSGILYVADTGNCTLRAISPSKDVTTVAGVPGIPGYADGSGPVARFNTPLAVTIDTNGNIIVSDSGNFTIRRVTPVGDVSTIGGVRGLSGCTNGIGSEALFYTVTGLTSYENAIFLADNKCNVIRLGTDRDPSNEEINGETGNGELSKCGTGGGSATAMILLFVASLVGFTRKRR